MATIDEEYSFNILNTCEEGLKVCFRTVERNLLKITALTSNLCFNETCLNNKILSIYTNIYILNMLSSGVSRQQKASITKKKIKFIFLFGAHLSVSFLHTSTYK